jgi:hypothetical protein
VHPADTTQYLKEEHTSSFDRLDSPTFFHPSTGLTASSSITGADGWASDEFTTIDSGQLRGNRCLPTIYRLKPSTELTPSSFIHGKDSGQLGVQAGEVDHGETKVVMAGKSNPIVLALQEEAKKVRGCCNESKLRPLSQEHWDITVEWINDHLHLGPPATAHLLGTWIIVEHDAKVYEFDELLERVREVRLREDGILVREEWEEPDGEGEDG